MEYEFFEELAPTRSAFWQRIDETPHFWANLAPYPWTDSLLCLARQLCPHVGIASVAMTPKAASGKLRWIQSRIVGLTHHIVSRGGKAMLAAPDRVLVDDCQEEVDAWNAAGGKAILFPQPWNAHRAYTDDRLEFVKRHLKELRSERGKKLKF